MTTYRLEIAYVGTNYSGWQIQPNGNSIQEEIEKALKILCPGESIRVIGSGRTDAGVHAKAQVAHFKSIGTVSLHSLNGLLPKDIRVKKLTPVEDTFHAQISAKRKTYRYQIYLNKIQDPFGAPYHWHVYDPLSIDLIREAARYFVGTHDFTSFANEASTGAAAKNGVRTLFSVEVIERGDWLDLEFTGNGFLYKMVRNIVGTLVEVGRGKIAPDEIPKLFAHKDRRFLSRAAPAQGLFLMSVQYEKID